MIFIPTGTTIDTVSEVLLKGGAERIYYICVSIGCGILTGEFRRIEKYGSEKLQGCGRLFNYMGERRFVRRVRKKLEEKFQEVKAFLEENPNSSVETVAEELDVSVKQIRQWIREERLSLSVAGADGIVLRPAAESRSAREDFMRSARTIWRTRLQSRFISRSRRSRRRQSGIKPHAFSQIIPRESTGPGYRALFCFENK